MRVEFDDRTKTTNESSSPMIEEVKSDENDLSDIVTRMIIGTCRLSGIRGVRVRVTDKKISIHKGSKSVSIKKIKGHDRNKYVLTDDAENSVTYYDFVDIMKFILTELETE